MARKHYWQFLVTDEGNPIENAEISIYKAGTEDPVYVYRHDLGDEGTDTIPQVLTSSKGYFEFWIGDEEETNGYSTAQKFKIAWYRTGVSQGYVDFVDVFSTSVAPVDETDASNAIKNKAVSNTLAYGWETHKDFILDPYSNEIHGITGTSDAGLWNSAKAPISIDENPNKLVSDHMVRYWTDHVENATEDHPQYSFIDGTRDFTAPVIGVRPTLTNHLSTKGYVDDVLAGFATEVDETDVNNQKNKLVSNLLAKTWTEHADNTTGTADHPQFTMTDGTRDFTAPVIGVYPTADDHLATKIYVDAKIGLPVDTADSDTLKNKLVSNFLATAWTDHVGNTTGSTDHPQFSHIDGTRDFTADVHGVATTGSSTDTTLVTKGYVDDSINQAYYGAKPLSFIDDTDSPADITSAYRWVVDTATAAVTVVLPLNPVEGETIQIIDYGSAGTNNITVDGNGRNIMGLADDMTVAVNNASIYVMFADDTRGWVVV